MERCDAVKVVIKDQLLGGLAIATFRQGNLTVSTILKLYWEITEGNCASLIPFMELASKRSNDRVGRRVHVVKNGSKSLLRPTQRDSASAEGPASSGSLIGTHD